MSWRVGNCFLATSGGGTECLRLADGHVDKRARAITSAGVYRRCCGPSSTGNWQSKPSWRPQIPEGHAEEIRLRAPLAQPTDTVKSAIFGGTMRGLYDIQPSARCSISAATFCDDDGGI